ncbi:MAG: hypothetical protein LUM44_09755 [Pyrinomonadaceae bacterium]|nr:hypothetical protein [Pyrinomonadaceae bacterium]
MFKETIEVSVTFNEKITFFLRMIGIAEENEYRQKLFGIPEADRAEKEYEANVSLLAELSEKLPDGMFGDSIPKGQPDFCIREYFAEKTVLKERIAFYAVCGYFNRLMPSESFL